MTKISGPSNWRWPALVLLLSLAVPATLSITASNATQPGPEGAVRASTQTARIGAASRVQVQASAKPFVPTAAQLADRERALAGKAKHVAPALGRHTTTADVNVSGGPETNATVAQAPGTFTVLKQGLVNSTCSGCGQSQINEPTVANSGRYVVETSNWNIAYSNNGGKAPIVWGNLSPYSFTPGFCCDQMVTYDAGRDLFILLQLKYAGEGNVNNGLAVSVARGSSPTSWCTYNFAGAIGGGSTSTPDFPKIAVANNNAYVTWNEYPPNAGFARSGLARFPLDSLSTCSAFSYNYVTRSTEFTFALSHAPSSLNQFYWVSNWFFDGTTSGQNLRIFYWPENSGSYNYVTRAINAYTFGTVSCGSPDWCSRLDPRWESVSISRAEYRAQANGAFAGDSILEVATSAGPSGFSNGKNYVVYNYFKLNSLAYIGNDQTYSTTDHFAYPGCGVNKYGYVGCAMAHGTNAPGGFILIKDDVNPTQPWGYSYPVATGNGATGWGDYIVTSPWNPTVGPFQTILWRVNASNVVEPYYIVWGRARDALGYKRWKTK